MTKKILILAANPKDSNSLRLAEEIRKIKDSLQSSELRDEFTIEQYEAVRLTDLYQAMLKYKPHYVHFCGHGEEDGIVLEDETGETKLISAKQLANLFKKFKDNLNCVILNACHTKNHAKAIAKFIPYSIGMKQSISDEATIEFAQFFYIGLFGGKPINEAFDMARNAIDTERSIPKLIQKKKDSKGETPVKTTTKKEVSLPKTKIVEALLACPSISDNQSRDAVLRELPPKISNAIQAHPKAKIHVTNIVNACLNFSDGLETLVDRIRFFDDGTKQMQALDAVLAQITL